MPPCLRGFLGVLGALVVTSFQKLQVRFAKLPSLRFLSHHDLMRALHRALRRAGVPVRTTEGYNPRPRVVLPHALEVGVSSEDEYVEIELSEWMRPAEFERRLSEALPGGLEVRGVSLMAPRRRGSMAVEAHYEAELGPEDALAAVEGVERFMASESWPATRVTQQSKERELDLRPHVLDVSLDGSTLAVRLRLGRPGAARPREVIAAVLDRDVPSVLDVPLRKTKTVLAGPA